jgi:peptidoglycan/LPS O-acetylase OafA/YrhL
MQLWLPFLIMLLYIAAYQGVAMRSFVRTQWIAITGGMCYTIYLWHAPIMTFMERITAKVPMLNSSDYGLLFLTRCLIQIPVIAVVSVLLFLLVERPCMDPRWPQKVRDYFARLFRNSAVYERAPEA